MVDGPACRSTGGTSKINTVVSRAARLSRGSHSDRDYFRSLGAAAHLYFSGFIANWLAYFVALPQHCGLRENVSDFRKSVRSIKLNPFVEFLHWHMNWHTEHHMYAGVPCYNLKKLHLELKDDMPEPRTLFGAWREMQETWQRQQTDPDYQFDTPLPATALTSRKRNENEAESSIGDLAPTGLK